MGRRLLERGIDVDKDADQLGNVLRTRDDYVRWLEGELLRSQSAAQAGRILAWELDISTQSIVFSPAPLDVFGFDVPRRMAGAMAAVHPADRPRLEAALARTMAGAEPYDEDHRLTPPGIPTLWVHSRGTLRNGRIAGFTRDMTALKEVEERQRRAIAGLQHRMKNTLAVVRSISARTLETSDSMESYATNFGGRLDAMARIQNLLARTPEGVELEDLVHDELAACLPLEGDQVEVRGPRVVLKDKAVEVVAMALHELSTNALKFGALSRPDGGVAIHWRLSGSGSDGQLELSWRERGVPALNLRPARIGFGRDLLERGLPYDLGAITKLTFAPGGIHYVAGFPLGDRIVPVDASAETADDAPGYGS